MRLENLIQVIQRSDLVPKIYPTDLGKVRVLDEKEPLCLKLHDRLKTLNRTFSETLSQLVVPLRFSVLALLTARKCTVFDEGLLHLMEYVRDQKFEDVHIYKVAKIGEHSSENSSDGSSSPKGDSSSSAGEGGSPK